MKSILKFINTTATILFLSVSFNSCLSTADLDYSPIENQISNSHYDEASYKLYEMHDYYYGPHDKVLSYLDMGILQHFAGDYEKSTDNLSKAEVEIQKNFTKSISQAVGSILINDTVIDYPGETYEDIYTNIFMCLNYIHLYKIEDAMVEIRRFDNKMKLVGKEYQAVIDSLKASVSSDFAKTELDCVDSEVKFHNSALARYLSMLLYRTAGDSDAARIDLEKINDAFKFQPTLYNFSKPQNLEEELILPEDNARVNFVCFTGKSPVKVEEVIRIPFANAYYKFAIPIMEHRPTNIRAIQAVLTNAETGNVYKVNLHAIESIDNIASDTYKQHFASIYARAVIRSVGKATTSGAYEIASRVTDDRQLSDLFTVLNFFSQISTEITERADVRISRYFPGYASVAGITVPEGFYNVDINFYNENKRKVYTHSIENVYAFVGELNLLEATYQH